jgi:hypothetical protein
MSFKVIKDFVEQPVLMIVCDRSCAYNVTCAVPPQMADDQTTQAAFIQQAVQQGWKVTLAEQVCPKHVEKERANESRILIPSFRAASANTQIS